jgi:hypothetical protein
LDEASPVTALLAAKADAAVMANTQSTLFSPQPLMAVQQAASVQQTAAAVPQATLRLASAETTAALPQPAPPPPAPVAKRTSEVKPAAVHNRTERPGYILNDAQIASIKTRLHLTANQEEMWPAVEAALRNIAYSRARDAKRRSANTQVADADGVDVRELKSAAVPLIMSFNSEQKDEVRNIAHVMGLDQLASQF